VVNSFWHESPLRRMGSGVTQERLAQALDFLTKFGVRVPPTGRHQRALKLIRSVNDEALRLDPTDAQLLRRLQHAHRDAYELFLIAYAASLRRKRADSPFTIQRLQALMSGRELGGGDPHPRNIQFELYVAAMLVLGSLEVTDGEPDLRLLYGTETIGVAAKRLTSLTPTQADRNFGKAVDQIARSRLRGLVAINLDSRFSGKPSTMPREERLANFEATFNTLAPIIEAYRVPNPHVLGYLAFGHLSEWFLDPSNENKPGLMTHAPFRWFGWPNTAQEKQLYLAFSDAWRSRVETHLERISSRDQL